MHDSDDVTVSRPAMVNMCMMFTTSSSFEAVTVELEVHELVEQVVVARAARRAVPRARVRRCSA